MDYEKKIRDYMNSSEVDQLYKSMLNNLFPELVEPKEEKARRSLLEFLEDLCKLGKNINFDRWSKADCEEWVNLVMKQGEQKPVDKVEPKFKVGDIIRHKEQGFTCKIIAVDTEYRLSECNGTHLPFDSQDAYELVEQNLWSEEDEEEFQIAIDTLVKAGQRDSAHWFKSLKDRYAWQPSEEQMIALKCAITTADEKWVCMNTKDLESLYQDLKKLKG